MSQRFQSVLLIAAARARVDRGSDGSAVEARASRPTQSVLTSGDIGFHVEHYEGSKPVGTLVVRVNGCWVEPNSAANIQLLHPRSDHVQPTATGHP